VPGDVEFRFIDQVRIDDPHVGHLVAKPRTYAVGGGGGQTATGSKGPKRVNQVKLVVNVAAVNAVSIVELIVDAYDVFAPVLWIVRLENRITGLDRVRESGGYLRHFGIDRSNSSAVGRDALRRKNIGSGEYAAGWGVCRHYHCSTWRQIEIA